MCVFLGFIVHHCIGSVSDYSQDIEHSLNWISTTRGCQWGGPVLDHWMTMLCTLLMPIRSEGVCVIYIILKLFLAFSCRDEFLCMLNGDGSPSSDTVQKSQRWTLVEEDLEEV